MRQFLAIVALVLAVVTPLHSTASASRVRGQADCSMATALRVGKPYFYDATNTVDQVLCGDFAGPGSEAMAVTFFFPVCWPVQRWVVFRFDGSDWRPIRDVGSFLIPPLEAVGSDIRETAAVHQINDARCLPSGGTRSRIWHWNGTQLLPGPWTQVTPGKPLTNAFFDSPRAVGTQCGMGEASVRCQSVKTRPLYFQTATLKGTGRVTLCRDSGNRNRCNLGNSGETEVPVLAYGQHVDVGRFRCESLRTGVRCTLIRTGQGFLINKSLVVRVSS
jgi:hypothetical protein